MSTNKLDELERERQQMWKRADEIWKAYGGLPKTNSEHQRELETIASRTQDLTQQIESLKRSKALVDTISNFGANFGTSGETKTAGAVWAKSVANKLSEHAHGQGLKALLSGQIDTPPAVEVVPLPDRPTRLIDLVPRQELDERNFSYLRQTVRTNNAAAVADGDLKPTSIFTFTEIEDRARVIAHLSEPFPVRFVDDHTSMLQVLDHQMHAGIIEAIEELIVSGDGDGEAWEGLLTVAGTTSVPFETDMVTTLRKARTALENKSEIVTAVALNPADVEKLDLLREDGTSGGFLLDGSAISMIFGQGTRGVSTIAVPEGTALLGDWSTVRLRVRQSAHTIAATQGGADEAGDLFDTNRVKLRTEGRYGFQVMRPQAIAVVELEDPGD